MSGQIPDLQPPEGSSLSLALRPIRALLADSEVSELCINRPGEAWLETPEGWQRRVMPDLSEDWCFQFARLVGNYSGQKVDATAPLLTAGLPGGERLQLAVPPATATGVVAIVIRRPAERRLSLGELLAMGSCQAIRRARNTGNSASCELSVLLEGGQYEAFMRLAVRSRCNILISGPTGAGKTTWTKALIGEIPAHERLISIEDAPELQLDHHPNHVRLFYSKDSQGRARLTARQLLESSLRMRPDRILLAELRGEEAFEYLRSVNSGHPGSITSIHASSALLAFEQLALLIRQAPAGRELSRTYIQSMLHQLIDVVIQFGRQAQQRWVEEIWFEPSLKRQPGPDSGAVECAR